MNYFYPYDNLRQCTWDINLVFELMISAQYFTFLKKKQKEPKRIIYLRYICNIREYLKMACMLHFRDIFVSDEACVTCFMFCWSASNMWLSGTSQQNYAALWLHGDWTVTMKSPLITACSTVTTIGSSVTMLPAVSNSDYTVTVQSPCSQCA